MEYLFFGEGFIFRVTLLVFQWRANTYTTMGSWTGMGRMHFNTQIHQFWSNNASMSNFLADASNVQWCRGALLHVSMVSANNVSSKRADIEKNSKPRPVTQSHTIVLSYLENYRCHGNEPSSGPKCVQWALYWDFEWPVYHFHVLFPQEIHSGSGCVVRSIILDQN